MYCAIPQLTEMAVGWRARMATYLAGAFAIGIVLAKVIELSALRLSQFSPGARHAVGS
jgi:hypothetical protein